MAQLLLINPRKRARKTAKRRTVAKRRHNPVSVLAAAPKRRRRNPIGLKRVHTVRRRRNPINTRSIMGDLKTAMIGGVGAVAVDVFMGQVANPYLPTSMQIVAGSIGVGDAVKMAITLAAGEFLKKPTKGLSRQMAIGALTVQSSNILRTFLPTTMTLGYALPARIVQGNQRVGPLMSRVGAYQPAGNTPLLGAYTRPGAGVMLSGARSREGITVR
jgi:hypothetical protein